MAKNGLDVLKKVEFIEILNEYKEDQNVSGIVLFGSWARGDNREDSDIDLLILQSGVNTHRKIRKINDQDFEILFSDPGDALNFWKNNLDNSKRFWDIAQILHDNDNFLYSVKKQMNKVYKQGKKPLKIQDVNHRKFDAYDLIKFLEANTKSNTVSVKMIMYDKVYTLIDLYYDINLIWKPAPKQLINDLSDQNSKLSDLVNKLYTESKLQSQIQIYKYILDAVFD